MTAPAHAAPAAAAPWTRVYWPAAVAVAVAALIALPGRTTAVAVGGALLLGVPELWFLARRQYASTLSDWTWHVLHVTRTQPVSQWTAAHFLAFAAYQAVAVRVCWHFASVGYWPLAISIVMAAWLDWHLFGRRFT